NIVVYFPSQEVLFGGCLIKSMASKGLGNTADAEISEWIPTIQKLKKEFKDIDIVIPGHGQYGNKELLDHTIELVKNYSQQ
ncbi:MAG: CfiA family subclass B1 metallo-beta-lactamase, partial [Bacteroidales bacterium]|nr:CfiA family subclass B1 metallo-beta-lactamase [Bacteroidales bacterium]